MEAEGAYKVVKLWLRDDTRYAQMSPDRLNVWRCLNCLRRLKTCLTASEMSVSDVSDAIR